MSLINKNKLRDVGDQLHNDYHAHTEKPKSKAFRKIISFIIKEVCDNAHQRNKNQIPYFLKTEYDSFHVILVAGNMPVPDNDSFPKKKQQTHH